MSEVNGKTLSISFRIDEGVIEHNNRIFIAKNANGYRITLYIADRTSEKSMTSFLDRLSQSTILGIRKQATEYPTTTNI